MNRIRQTIELMHATCKEVSMRRKLVAYWASMIFVLLAAMLILASLFGVFSIRESNLPVSYTHLTLPTKRIV